MVRTLADSDRLGRRHVCRQNPIAIGVKPGIARLQQGVKIAVRRPTRGGGIASIGASGEVYFCAGGDVQGIRSTGDGYLRLRDAQETAGLNLHASAFFGAHRTFAYQIQFTFPGDLYGARLCSGNGMPV